MAATNPMQKTLRIGSSLPMKSVPVRCRVCGKLMRIEKEPPDTAITSVKFVTCYACRKNR
jgi:hypothetical protein